MRGIPEQEYALLNGASYKADHRGLVRVQGRDVPAMFASNCIIATDIIELPAISLGR
jgi:hypothetical protein